MGAHHRTHRPAPAVLTEEKCPRPAPEFVEGLMGLPAGWVNDPEYGLTTAQKNTALLPSRQASHSTHFTQTPGHDDDGVLSFRHE